MKVDTIQEFFEKAFEDKQTVKWESSSKVDDEPVLSMEWDEVRGDWVLRLSVLVNKSQDEGLGIPGVLEASEYFGDEAADEWYEINNKILNPSDAENIERNDIVYLHRKNQREFYEVRFEKESIFGLF